MKWEALPIVAGMLLHIAVSGLPSAAAGSLSAAEYEQQWSVVIVSLLKFVQASSSADTGPLSANVLPKLDAERGNFDRAIVKLLLADPPEALLRRHLTLMPICQELATVMVLITDGLRRNDTAATQAARRWMTERLVDLSLAMQKLESGN